MSGGSQARRIDVAELVAREPLGRFHFRVGLWLFLVVLLDGYELLAGGFAAPAIIKAWHVAPAQMRYFLSASLFGVMFGAIFFGFLGDRLGRKTALVAAAAFFGVATLGCALAPDLAWLTIFRFIAGIGIGGVLPNSIALAAEMAPQGAQATFITLMFIGTPAGSLLAGPVAAWLVPHYGWPVIFWIGGLLPLLVAALLAFVLPESILFLAQDGARRAQLAAVVQRLAPRLRIEPGDELVLGSAPAGGADWLALFRAPFTLITPLLALLFVINFMVLYFMVSWMPQLLNQATASPTLGIWATSLFELAGVAGGLVLGRLLDKRGLAPVTILFAVAVPVIAVTGYAAHTPLLLLLAAFVSGLCIVGLQFGLNVAAGIIYPTASRSNGVGFAFGVGRLGAVAGPLFGGALIALALPVRSLYLIAAAPMAVGALVSFWLVRLTRKQQGRMAGQRALS